jgi:hypothetical protein
MTITPSTKGPLDELVDQHLLDELVEVAGMRVSARSMKDLANIEENGRRALSHVHAVQFLNGLPDNLLEDSPKGEEARRVHGVMPLLRRHASPFADQPNAAMGFAVPAPPNGVVLLIHDTAAEANVTVPGDPLPRVAFAELMVAMFHAYPTLQDCFFAAWARWIRDRDPAQRIMQASQLFAVKLWNGDKPVDLNTSSGSLMAEIEGTFAADERKAIRKRTTVGVLNGLIPGYKKDVASWPYAYAIRPLGYDLARTANGAMKVLSDGKSKWRPIEPASASEVSAVREMLRLFGAGATKADCATPLADAEVPCRGTKVDPGKTFRDLSREERANAVSSMINEQNLHLWKTGIYLREKAVPIPTDGDLDGYAVVPRHGTYGYIAIDTDFGLPEGGFLDDETSAAVQRRLDRRESKEGPSRENCAMFAYLDPYQDNDGATFQWQRRIKRTADAYCVLQRPASACVDRADRPRGWTAGEGEKLIVVRQAELEDQVAQALRTRLILMADQLAPLQLLAARPDDAAAALRERLAESELQYAALISDADAADALARGCAAPGPGQDLEAATRHSRHASTQHAAAANISVLVERLTVEVASAVSTQREEIALLDPNLPASLAGFMSAYAGQQVPTFVNQLLRRHGANSLRLEHHGANSRRVRWSITFTFPLTDGTPAEIALEGYLRNRRRDQDHQINEAEVVEAIAEDFLRNGIALDDIVARYGPNRAAVVKRLRGWLQRQGVHRRGLRSAIVDMPTDFAETRGVLWSCLTGELSLPASLEPLRRHIAETYLGEQLHPNSYVREDCTLARQIMTLMRDGLPVSGERGVDVAELAKATGATETQINALCTPITKTPTSSERGILVRDQHNYRVVRLRPCPHVDCSATPSHRYLTHYLPVPETKLYAGLLCTSCGRLPDDALVDLVFPVAYFDTMWEGPADPGNTNVREGPSTVAAIPGAYATRSRLPRSARQYSISEAARFLGVTDWGVRSWVLDPDDPMPATRTQGRSGSRYLIAQSTLDALEDDPRLERIRQTCARELDPELTGLIPLAALARRTGVAEHFLRKLMYAGSLVPATRATGMAGSALFLFHPTVADPAEVASAENPLTIEWVKRHQSSHASIGQAASSCGMTTNEMRKIIDEGELLAYRTDGGTRVVDAADLTRWTEDRAVRGPWVAPPEATKISGMSSEQLRTAAERGKLSVRRTPGGHRRYRAKELSVYPTECIAR